MKPRHVIFGVHLDDRVKEAPDVQKVFTEFGCYIRTRIGLHHVDEDVCSPRGLILLEMFGDEEKCAEMKQRLQAMKGLEIQEMVFDHPR
jgi:hypothetical protein